MQDFGLTLPLRPQDGRLPFAFRKVDGGLALALGFGDFGSADGIGGLLPLHGRFHAGRRVNLVDFHLGYLDAPTDGYLIHADLHVVANALPFRQRGGKVQRADYGPQRGESQVDYSGLKVLDFQHSPVNRVFHHPVVDDEVHVHHHVVGGDVLLSGHAGDALTQVNLGAAVQDGNQEAQAGAPGADVGAETLDDHALVLLYDDKPCGHGEASLLASVTMARSSTF